MKIGVISDTHNFIDPRISRLFAGVDHILHGGDVGNHSIVRALEEIAPTTVVMGNTDDPAQGYRLTQSLELDGTRFLIHHIVNPYSLSESLRRTITLQKPHVLIFGHTHKPFAATMSGTFFFNPGYAGQPRFGMPRSLALLHIEGTRIQHEYLPLP